MMKEQIIKTIEILKERVKHNLSIINNNEKEVRKILDEPSSKSRSAQLEEKYSQNRRLLKENNDSIQLQLQLTKYIEAYREHWESDNFDDYAGSTFEYNEDDEDDMIMYSQEEYFELTINGEIKFDPSHPFFNDDQFFNDLLNYYKSIEDYETCGFLIDKKNNASE